MGIGFLLEAGISFVGMAITYFILVKFVKYITFFSKAFVALVISGLLYTKVTLIDASPMANFATLFAIGLAVCALLSLLPRINFAITYLCDYLLILIVSTMCTDLLLKKFISDFSFNKIFLVCMCIIDAFITYRLIQRQVNGGRDIPFAPLRIFDRAVASLINSITFFTAVLFSVNFPDNNILFFAALGAMAVVMYVADIFLFERITESARFKLPKENFGAILSGISSGSSDYRDYNRYDGNDQQRRQQQQFFEQEMEYHREEQERWAREEKEQQDFDRWYRNNYGD